MRGRHNRDHDRAFDVRSDASRHRRDRKEWRSAMVGEAVATFTLLLAILGGLRHAPQAVPWLVGLTITATYWFTSSTSFANPAVTLARGFTTTFAGIAINHVPGFVAAQLVGAAIAMFTAATIFGSSTKIDKAAR
jgi:glycerol uptake facilitator-like aquaporin